MLLKIVLFITGVLLTALSLVFIILYLNVLNLEYSFLDFVNFIISRGECWLIFIGILLIILSLKKGKEKRNDIYL